MDIIKVEFKSDIIDIVQDGIQWVAVKAITNNLGIKFDTQHKRLKSDESYQSKLVEVQTAGGKQKVFCIPYDKLNAWLFSINPSRVKPEVRQKLIEYKKECSDVLYNYFNKGYALNPELKEKLELKIQQLEKTILEQNRIIAEQPTSTLSSPQRKELLKEIVALSTENDKLKLEIQNNDIFMSDPALHNDFLDFLYQANIAVMEVNNIRHLSPQLDKTHQSLSNFMLFITRRYDKIRGVEQYKIKQITK